MSRREAWSEINVQSLLESAKEVPPQPDDVRARVLARARAAAAVPLPPVVAPSPRPLFPRQLLAPASVAGVAAAVVCMVYALGGRSPRQESAHVAPSGALRGGTAAPAVAVASSLTVPSAAPVSPPPIELDATSRVKRPASNSARRDWQESYGAELELMRSAHNAYAAQEFTSALVLVGEHARRFPGGLLSEEREALRVRCLLGAGRSSQARVAAAAFAASFPRSVLLRRIQAEVGASAD